MLTKTDRMIIDEMQYRFPLSARPYLAIARRLRLQEYDVITRTRTLQERGVIRYTGTIFNLHKLGVASTLVALSVPAADIARVSKIIKGYPNVSHNYLRNGAYNMWFTVSATSKKRLKLIVRKICRSVNCGLALKLDTEKVFKAKAVFSMAAG